MFDCLLRNDNGNDLTIFFYICHVITTTSFIYLFIYLLQNKVVIGKIIGANAPELELAINDNAPEPQASEE